MTNEPRPLALVRHNAEYRQRLLHVPVVSQDMMASTCKVSKVLVHLKKKDIVAAELC